MESSRTDSAPNPAEKGGAGPAAQLQTVLTVAAGLIGLTAYIYLLGGAVLWLRIFAARLPADNATVAFQDRVLLAIGLRALLFELALLAAVGAVVWVAWRVARRLDRENERQEEQLVSYVILLLLRSLIAGLTLVAIASRPFVDVYSGEDAALVLLVIAFAGLVIGAIDLTGLTPHRIEKVGEGLRESRPLFLLEVATSAFVIFVAVTYMAVALGLTVLVLLALLLLGRRTTLLPEVENGKDLVLPVLVIAAALNIVIVPYLATPPVTFDHVQVTTREDDTYDGAFLGRTDEGVFLATCEQKRDQPTESKEARVQVIPVADIEHVLVGGFKYSFDAGNRPSIYALLRHFATGKNMDRSDVGFELDVRAPPDVCGEKVTD